MIAGPLFALVVMHAAVAAPEDQPDWTLGRAFTNSRVFVLPAQTLQLDYGLDYKALLDGSGNVDFISQYALQWGLGHGLQVDISLFTEQNDYLAPLQVRAEDLRVRWAWAAWGVLRANPTLMVHLTRLHGLPPQVGVSIDLGEDSMAGALHWSARLGWQRELRGISMAQVYTLRSAALFDTAESTLRAGAEAAVDLHDHAGARFAFDRLALRAGPSSQWLPVEQLSLLLAVYAGWQMEQDDGSSSSSWFLEPHFLLAWYF